MALATVLSDGGALIKIKEGSRKLYRSAFNQLKQYLNNDLETRPPTEEELLNYFKFLRFDRNYASSSIWTQYSMINGVCKGTYSFNLKSLCRVVSLIKSFDTDVKTKAKIFAASDINKFTDDKSISSPYWLVRKAVACLAFYGGLRQSELMNLKLEMFETTSDGVYVTYMGSKQRSDK